MASYGYDGAGNQTDGGTHSFNSVNQLTDSGYSYDLNGNLLADPSRTYEWDAANRLTSINYTGISARTEFTYDGLSRRVKIVEKGLPVAAISLSLTPTANTKKYTVFTSSTVSLAAGNYIFTIAGLNPNGGTNTALVDTVTLNTTLVSNGGFETPAIAANSAQLNPTGGSPWTFSGTSGISRNTSGLMGTSAPAGAQVGLVQNTGKISQPLTLAAGSYSFKATAAQASGNTSSQTLQVTIQSATMVVTSTKQFIWNGSSMVEERDGNNSVLRRFYPQGEQISGANYCYMKDHLGSIVELNDSTGATKAEYGYDWWGNRTKRSGTLDSEFGYTGFYYHQPSSLNLALYRAYDVSTMRWISRDPLKYGETRQGPNLYGYGADDPVNASDPLGLDVNGVFDLANRTLTLTDAQTGATVSIHPVWSGNGANANNSAAAGVYGAGPLPLGTYLIGNPYEHPEAGHPGDMTWYKLYGPDGRGGYSYDRIPVTGPDGNQVIRGQFNIHTGLASDGCVTVPSDVGPNSPNYPSSAEYDELKQLLNQTLPFDYKGSSFLGTLTVK